MRTILFIVLLLTLAGALWSAAGHFAIVPQQGETRAELRKSQATGLSDAEISVHVARLGAQGRNLGIASLIFCAAATGALTALIMTMRSRHV
jgi:hypothetical protein